MKKTFIMVLCTLFANILFADTYVTLPYGDGIYTISNTPTSQYIFTYQLLTDKGTSLITQANSGGPNGKNTAFYFKNIGNKIYTITQISSGLVMDVSGNYTSNGSSVAIWDNNGGKNQQWHLLTRTTNGKVSYVLRGVGSNRDLTISQGDQNTSRKLQIEDENSDGRSNWLIEGVLPIDPGVYTIQGVGSNLNIAPANNSSANNTRLVLANPSTAQIQKWNFTSLGNGLYKISNLVEGRVIDVLNAATSNSSPTQIYDFNGTGGYNQKWVIWFSFDRANVRVRSYTIGGANTGRDLAVQNNATTPGSAILIFDSNTGSNQRWLLNPVSSGSRNNLSQASIAVNDLNESGIVVYPNPTSTNLVNIKGVPAGSKISLINEAGKLVKVIPASTSSIQQVNLEGIAKGTYFLNFQNTDGSLVGKPIQVNNL